MRKLQSYDVLILGGGLAGLTLALQLKQADAAISILVLEKRRGEAAAAAHKVGESLSELGAHYLREVLNLKDYLTESHLRKLGFRFFMSQQNGSGISERVEVGSRIDQPVPSHQIDRGILENDLIAMLRSKDVDIVSGARADEVQMSENGHRVMFESEGETVQCDAAWLIDASGRNSILKRKLGLNKTMEHHCDAAWFRLDYKVDIDDWSEDNNWKHYLGAGRRRLATNHLMGEGYWVWIIPLVNDRTSIGIVADPAFHPFETYNTFEKAMNWLRQHEPLAAEMLEAHAAKQMDFRVIKHFAHDVQQFFSADRWGLTGESGAFMDPFYSPGSDFIALSNTWLCDLIVRERSGEQIAMRTMVYQHALRELLNGWMLLYQNMYGVFGKTQIMLMKIVWDWSTYWGIPVPMFMNNGYTDLNVLKQYSSASDRIGQRFALLNTRMQKLFRDWGNMYAEPEQIAHLNVFSLNCLQKFHMALYERHSPQTLIKTIGANLDTLEQIAAEIFRRVSRHLHGTPEDMPVDVYAMDINDGKDKLIEASKTAAAREAVSSIQTDIAQMWLYTEKSVQKTYGH